MKFRMPLGSAPTCLFLCLLALLALSVFVSAQPPALPGGFVPAQAGLKLQLYKGWNLVKFPSNVVGQADASTCLQADLAASFVYDIQTRSYVEVGSQRFTQFMQANPDYLAHTAVWVEVKRNCTITVSNSSPGSISLFSSRRVIRPNLCADSCRQTSTFSQDIIISDQTA